MRLDLSGFSQVSRLDLGTGKKDYKDQTATMKQGGFFSPQKSDRTDEFIEKSAVATNPFYTDNKEVLKYLKPKLVNKPEMPDPVSATKGLMENTCNVGNVAKSMINLIDLRDSYTGAHSKAVQKYSVDLAKSLDLSEQEVELINLGAAFHDIGKIGTPESILKKESKLTDEEYTEMKKHSEAGSQILENIPPFKGMIAQMTRHHHEAWDGTGYPDKLSGKGIPLGARIIAIADSYHAMTSDRPYRKGLPKEEAVRRLNDGAGSQWDPELVEKFTSMIAK